MKEEKTSPEAQESSQDEAEATPQKTAPADDQSGTDDVQAYAEPPDASGGGK